MKAARMLNEGVEKHLRDAGISVSRVIVRIYADLTGLSKSLGKAKLVGLEKRSLGAFAAGFTRGINLFDFVDALDEEGTRFKIRGKWSLPRIARTFLTILQKCSIWLLMIAHAVISYMLRATTLAISLSWFLTRDSGTKSL